MRAPRARRLRRRARRARRADARHPDDRDARRPPQRGVPPRRPALDRRRHAQERARRAQAPRRHPRAARHRPARRPRGRPEAPRGPARARPRSSRSTRPSSPSTRRWSRATSAPACWGRRASPRIRYLVDPRVVEGTRWVTGADVDGKHVLDLVAGRDFTADGTIEAAEVRDGDPCPSCDAGTLEIARGIEIGHIFQLGRKYADALDLKVLDENGKLVTVTMGSYGIGVSRAVAAIAESTPTTSIGLVLAARGRAGRRAPGRDRQGRGGLRRRRAARRRPRDRPASRSSTTTAPRSRPA